MTQPHNFTNQYVRDLAWAIASPCIIQHSLTPPQNFFADEYERALPMLLQLDAHPQALTEFLQNSKRKALGIYFEDLIAFWLAHRESTSSCSKIIARNLQIIDAKQTLGECDFIVDLDGQITHLEVAIKYYIAEKNSAEQKFWVGRNKIDRLDLKFNKLFEQQLRLSDNPAVGAALLQHNTGKIERKMAIIKGYFFKHYFTKNHALPQFATTDDNAFWCKISEFDMLPEKLQFWQILHKPHWLTYSDATLDRTQMQQLAEQNFSHPDSTPILCNGFCAQEPSQDYLKLFIVPDLWSSF